METLTLDRRAHRLFRRRVCLCTGSSAHDLAEPVGRDGRHLQSRARLRRRADAPEHRLLLHRRAARHRHRRAARHRAGDHGCHAAADLVHAAAGVGADPARRHLLRRAVRRLDHGHPGQHPGRGVVGRHHHRRPPDGAARSRRTGARHRRHRLVLRRLRLDAADRVRGAAARGRRAAIRPGGIFLADGLRADRGRRAGARLAAQGGRHGRARAAARARRHRRELGRATLQFRHDRARRRHRVRRALDGDLRHRRGRLQSREDSRTTSVVAGAVGRVWPSLTDLQALHRLDPARHRARRDSRRAAGGGALLASFAAYTLEKNVAQRAAHLRPGRHPRRGGAGIRQQCRRADLVHPDADLGHSRQSDHGDDDRGADDPRHRARARA